MYEPNGEGYEECTRICPMCIQNIQLAIYTCSHDGHQTRTFRNGETPSIDYVVSVVSLRNVYDTDI